MNLALSKIEIGKRCRKNIGNIDELADSMASLGQLQEIVLAPDNKLICGERRVLAAKKLGWDTIRVYVAETFDNAYHYILAEKDENTCRKQYEIEEAIAIGERAAKAYKPIAIAAQKAANSCGKEGGRGKKKTLPVNYGKGKQEAKRKARKQETTAQAATAAGMSQSTFEKGQKVIASGDRKLIDEMNRTGKVSGAHKKLKNKEAVEQIIAEPPPLPKGPFRIIVIDPPWSYRNRPNDPSHRAANPYPPMPIEEIQALDIEGITHKDSILWLWTTNAFLPDVWPIIKAWGFTYKTMLTWVKNKMGMGDWLRGKTEHCLMCVKGKPTIKLTNQTTVLHGKMRKHSQKPEEFYTFVEELCPGSKVELFQRTPREGWTSHGNEV